MVGKGPRVSHVNAGAAPFPHETWPRFVPFSDHFYSISYDSVHNSVIPTNAKTQRDFHGNLTTVTQVQKSVRKVMLNHIKGLHIAVFCSQSGQPRPRPQAGC